MTKNLIRSIVFVLFVTTALNSVAQESEPDSKQQSSALVSTVSVVPALCKVTQKGDTNTVYITLQGVKPDTNVVVCAPKSSNCIVATVAEGPAGNLWSCATSDVVKQLKVKIPFIIIITYPASGLINTIPKNNDEKQQPQNPDPDSVPNIL